MEQLNYNLLFRWFVGLNMDEGVWDPTVYSKNRERMLKANMAKVFFQAVVHEAREEGLLSDEHFSVDGTLIEAWASQKSFQKKESGGEEKAGDNNGKGGDDGNVSVDFHGEKSGPMAAEEVHHAVLCAVIQEGMSGLSTTYRGNST